MSETERLSKRLTQQLPCSRREAELYIEGGWVTVDGRVVEEPQFKVGDQQIALLPGAVAETLPPVTLLLHKPAGLGCGMGANSVQQLLNLASRSPDDASSIRPLQRHFSRLDLLTPLETDASGLLVFSQSRAVIRLFKEDGDQLEHEYVVEVAGELAGNGLKRLAFGLSYKGVTLPPCKVSWQSETRLRFAIKAVQPGQLRFMCESVGLQVLNIRRLRIGRTGMAKLPVGQWRYLGAHEKF
ncbi:RNA-binding protein [Pseudomonas alcaligenes]|uniref:Dual-specificity RNA pseudouridine synthase RluF n=1 Tax=Aquipseudomonas alcaligenes TaxID=43263 RepID=A0ABR7S4J5_AQUAC|nr:rRNA pseudouridine synthase [Pseudomonas alcaligenes]MBC9251521.1 RNA-binding protein [Pseudomonas alcaligenes]